MSLKAPEQQATKNFTPQEALEPGGYPARISRVIDLGLQPQIDFTTKEPKKPAYMISVTYELVDAFMVGADGVEMEDKPRWESEEFPLHALSSDLAKSTKRMKAIDPQNELKGDWAQALGRGCTVVLGTYQSKKNPGVDRNKIMNVTSARPRDIQNMPALQNEARFFDLSAPDVEFFKSLPAWLQEKIKSNLEYAGSPLQAALGEGNVPAPKPKKEAPAPVDEYGEADDGVGDDVPWA